MTGCSSRNGTEAEKDDNPVFKVDRHWVEHTATLNDKTEEILTERRLIKFLASVDYGFSQQTRKDAKENDIQEKTHLLTHTMPPMVELNPSEDKELHFKIPKGVCSIEEIFEMEQITTVIEK